MLETSHSSRVFRGVHFALFGFDHLTENKVFPLFFFIIYFLKKFNFRSGRFFFFWFDEFSTLLLCRFDSSLLMAVELMRGRTLEIARMLLLIKLLMSVRNPIFFFLFVCLFSLILTWNEWILCCYCRTIRCVLLRERMERRWWLHCGLNIVLILECLLMLPRFVSSFLLSVHVLVELKHILVHFKNLVMVYHC